MDEGLEGLLATDLSLDLDDIDSLVATIPATPTGGPPRAATRPDIKEPPPRNAGEATGVGHNQVVRTRAARRITYDLKNVPNAVRLIRPLPDPGWTIHAVMGGDFAAWDLVPAILELAGRPCDELTIATLGFNERNNHHLCQLLESGQVRAAHVLASDYFAKADAATFRDAKAALAARGATLASTRNHAKVICLAIGTDRYVVEGSANLRSCNNLEQITLTNDAEVFEFHRRWIRSIPATPA